MFCGLYSYKIKHTLYIVIITIRLSISKVDYWFILPNQSIE